MRKKGLLLMNGVFSACLLLLIQACTQSPRMNPDTTGMKGDSITVSKAICVLHGTEGNMVSGTVTFTKSDSGVVVVADIKGLTPGKHGFHVHEYGDCSALDAKSAGGHFNPENKKHAGPNDPERHAGDLGNIVAGPDSTAHFQGTDALLTLNGKHSIIGRAIIVHAGEDDLTSQPSGNSGARVACGVIGIAKEE